MERLDAYMARANAAYYATRDPFADFTTAPEITQVFGELLGAWAVVNWRAMGSPAPVLLAEAGPGRGTLIADALRLIARIAPDFGAALRLHLVETSPRLRRMQQDALAALGQVASWHESMYDLPSGPLLLLANEFLDALPIRQFIRRGAGWTERFVCNGEFVEQPAALPCPDPAGAPEGTVREWGETASTLVRHVAERMATGAGGVALFLDYGPERSGSGESMQALRAGRPADPLADPGQADLTAHVDFAGLAGAARAAGAAVHGPVPQGLFLARLGLFRRTDALARGQTPARALALVEAARRLAEPDRMGRLFKAMAICHPDLPPPAGFEA